MHCIVIYDICIYASYMNMMLSSACVLLCPKTQLARIGPMLKAPDFANFAPTYCSSPIALRTQGLGVLGAMWGRMDWHNAWIHTPAVALVTYIPTCAHAVQEWEDQSAQEHRGCFPGSQSPAASAGNKKKTKLQLGYLIAPGGRGSYRRWSSSSRGWWFFERAMHVQRALSQEEGPPLDVEFDDEPIIMAVRGDPMAALKAVKVEGDEP